MKLNTQNGFAPVFLVMIFIIGSMLAGGGYVVYKDRQQMKKVDLAVADLLKQKESDSQPDNTPNATVKNSESIIVEPIRTADVEPAVSLSDSISCDNYDCLISAAKQCQPASLTVTLVNESFPISNLYLYSAKNKYELKKSSGVNGCTFSFST